MKYTDVVKRQTIRRTVDDEMKKFQKRLDEGAPLEEYMGAAEVAKAVLELPPDDVGGVDGDRIVMLASQIRYISDVALRETEGDGASEQRIAGNIAHCCMIIDELAAQIERCIEEVDTP